MADLTHQLRERVLKHRLAAFWCSDAPTIVEVVEGIRTSVDVMGGGNLHAQNNAVDAGGKRQDQARVGEKEQSYIGKEADQGRYIRPTLIYSCDPY